MTIRHPSESYQDYRARRIREASEFKQHMQGRPLLPQKEGKTLMILSKSRGAKKQLLAKLGVNGKRLRALIKRERRQDNANT